MRFQPSVPEVLATAIKRLDRAAAESGDAVLSYHTLTPLARLLEHLRDRFDEYVPCRLAEIDRLAALCLKVRDHLDPAERLDLDQRLQLARGASGRMRVSELENICDALNATLIAFQESLGGLHEPEIRQLCDEMWAEQVRNIRH